MEKDIEAWLREEVRRAGGVALKLTNPAGIPDRLLLLPNATALFIELKTLTGSPAPIQLFRLEQLHRLGFRAILARGQAEVRDAFRFALEISQLSRSR